MNVIKTCNILQRSPWIGQVSLNNITCKEKSKHLFHPKLWILFARRKSFILWWTASLLCFFYVTLQNNWWGCGRERGINVTKTFKTKVPRKFTDRKKLNLMSGETKFSCCCWKKKSEESRLPFPDNYWTSDSEFIILLHYMFLH